MGKGTLDQSNGLCLRSQGKATHFFSRVGSSYSVKAQFRMKYSDTILKIDFTVRMYHQ